MPWFPTPVVLGINWYTAFDRPIKARDGSWWLPRAGQSMGTIRGGHAICIRPDALRDSWRAFYDQGFEGACVGFAISRMMSLLNRERYSGHLLYHEAQLVDGFSDTPPEEGTTVRAGCDVARTRGLWKVHAGQAAGDPCRDCGISENRWATDVAEICACLDPVDGGAMVLNRGWVRLVNSWGLSYPEVRLDLEVLNRLVFLEGGEATVVTDVP